MIGRVLVGAFVMLACWGFAGFMASVVIETWEDRRYPVDVATYLGGATVLLLAAGLVVAGVAFAGTFIIRSANNDDRNAEN